MPNECRRTPGDQKGQRNVERHRGAERFVNVDRKNEKRYVRALTEKGKKEEKE